MNSVKNNGGHKKCIGIYLKFSNSSQNQTLSYDLQLSILKEYVVQHQDWVTTDIFADEVFTDDANKELIEFNCMIEACQQNKLDYIVTRSFTTFARNTLDTLQYIEILKDMGIGIYFENEKIDTMSSESTNFINILSAMAEEESQLLSNKTKWRVQKSFQQGRVHCPTTYFLGYDTDEAGNIVINEEQAEVVRRIFSEFLEGKGTPTIAKGLSEDGVHTARGNTSWTGNAVYKILKQEKYYGAVRTQKTVTLDPITHKRVRNIDIEPQYLIKNNHPPIISEETFHAVQKELERRQNMSWDSEWNHPMNYSGKTPFSGKLFCGECGRPVTRRKITSQRKGEKYHFAAWQCRVSACKDPAFKECKAKYVWETELEKAFIRAVLQIKEERASVVSKAQKIINEYILSIAEQDKLQELDEKVERVTIRIREMAARASNSYDPVYDLSLQQLIEEQENIQREHDDHNRKKQEYIRLQEQLKVMLISLDALDESAGSDNFRGDIFSKTIDKAIIYNNQQVIFHFKFGIQQMANAQRGNDV